MDMYMIASLNVTIMAVVAAVCILGPIVAAIIAANHFKSGPGPVIGGILIYLVCQIFVRTPVMNLLYAIPGMQEFMDAHGILRDLLLSLTTAVIEETGRWAAFLLVLRKRANDHNAIPYGIGHGGTEVALSYGLAYVMNYTYAQSINLSLEQPLESELMDVLYEVYPTLSTLTVSDMLLTLVIAATSICLQVMYTFIVARGVRYHTSKICLPLAMAMHFAYTLVSSLLGRIPESGLLWQAIFGASAALFCMYYLLEARRRAVMNEYEERRK